MNATKKARLLFCLATAALFITNSIFGPAALAETPPVGPADAECVQQLHTGTISGTSYLSNFSVSGAYSYYNQLDSAQKVVYNALKTLTPETEEVSVTLESPVTSSDPEHDEAAAQTIQKQFQPAIEALLKDCPEICWLKFGSNGCGFKWTWNYTGSEWAIRSVTFIPAVLDAYASDAATLQDELNNKLSSINVSGLTRKDKVQSIHDALADRFSYDTSFSNTSYDAYGALKTNKAVCEGYSEVFKLLCDRENIPCILIVGYGTTTGSGSGENHMWNAVCMEDGKWYGVDVTWDDQSEVIYDFFLVGTDTEDTNFGVHKFSQTHQASGNFSSGMKTFTYPALSPVAYSVPGNPNSSTDTPQSVEPTTAKKIQVTVPTAPPTTAPPVVITAAPTVVTAAPTSASPTPTQAGAQPDASQAQDTGKTVQSDSSQSTSVESQTLAGSVITRTTRRSDASADESAEDVMITPGQSSSLGLIIGVVVIIILIAAGVVTLLLLKKKKSTSYTGD